MVDLHWAQVRVEQTVPPLVVVSGEINYKSASSLKEALTRLIKEGHARICLDCGTVDFIDSSGIGAIVGAAGELKALGGELFLQERTRQLEHALIVSGFASLIKLHGFSTDAPEIEQSSTPSGLWQTLTLSLPLGSNENGTIPRRVTELAQTMPFTRDELDDIRLAVGEAASNAFRHGTFSSESDRVNVMCVGSSSGLTVEIRNPGAAFDHETLGPPDITKLPEGGMGIYFMRASMDSTEFEFTPGTVSVRMIKNLRRNE